MVIRLRTREKFLTCKPGLILPGINLRQLPAARQPRRPQQVETTVYPTIHVVATVEIGIEIN